MAVIHPRALIRHALVRVLGENAGAAALMGDRIFPDRMEHWFAEELPACGVYTLSEVAIESDLSPEPDERRISLVCELLARFTENVDDHLDALCLAVEEALQLDAIGGAMGRIVDEAREKAGLPPLEPVKVNGVMRHPADTLLVLKLCGTDIDIAVDGNREIGVAAMNFDLEYAAVKETIPLPDFLVAVSGWDVQPADGLIDMVSRVEFPAPGPEPDKETDGILPSAAEQIDTVLKE